jgi:hypothetical protein
LKLEASAQNIARLEAMLERNGQTVERSQE